MDRKTLAQEIFYEAAYFAQYPDAQREVQDRRYTSGRDHWDRVGLAKGYIATWVVPLQKPSGVMVRSIALLVISVATEIVRACSTFLHGKAR